MCRLSIPCKRGRSGVHMSVFVCVSLCWASGLALVESLDNLESQASALEVKLQDAMCAVHRFGQT
eukprot:9363398-Alexandrium_andersonii.AAC.1